MCLGNLILSLHASGRAFYLNLFKCIHSDYKDPNQTRVHLEKLVRGSGVRGIALISFQHKHRGNQCVCLFQGLHKIRNHVWGICRYSLRDGVG